MTAKNSTRILSVQVGLPRTLGVEGANDPMDRPWTSGFQKDPVQGPVWLGNTNLEGDGQADLVHHGGVEKAVLAYSAHHYEPWCRELNLAEIPFGAFGENFTIQGLTEADVCVGDTWQVGENVLVQVSQPRQPCWKLARRFKRKTLSLEVQRTGRTGWYFRVLRQGMVSAGTPITLLQRPYPDWSIARANLVMHSQPHDQAETAELAALDLLSVSWRDTLGKRLESQRPADPTARLLGQNDL